MMPAPPATGLRIPYEAEAFPPGTTANISRNVPVSWNDLLWAALTIGRPNLHAVLPHGGASYHEAIFRLSIVRLALEQRRTAGQRYYRTDAFKRLDPTEKGAISYFLGLTLCGVFASKLLNTPWLLHLDVFGPSVGATLTGRSRPDLVGQNPSSGAWHAFECKGRATPPNASDKEKAKLQAGRILSVGGHACTLHVASFAFFKGDRLTFYWRDPPGGEKGLRLPEPSGAGAYHYGPVLALLDGNGWTHDGQQGATRIEEADLEVQVHPKIAGALRDRDFETARIQARQLGSQFRETGFQLDGLKVQAGPSWRGRFRPSEP